MIFENEENLTDFRLEQYSAEKRMEQIVQNCPFFGRESETKKIMLAFAAGLNVVLYGKAGFGKTAFSEWAKKSFGCTTTNIVILEDYDYLCIEKYGQKEYYIHPEIMDKCELRIKFDYIENELFKELCKKGMRSADDVSVTPEEIYFWREKINEVTIPDIIIEAILKMRKYSADGEWQKAMKLVKAAAYFDGCTEVQWKHLNILADSVLHDSVVDSNRNYRIDDIVRAIKSTLYSNTREPCIIDGVSYGYDEAGMYLERLFS